MASRCHRLPGSLLDLLPLPSPTAGPPASPSSSQVPWSDPQPRKRAPFAHRLLENARCQNTQVRDYTLTFVNGIATPRLLAVLTRGLPAKTVGK